MSGGLDKRESVSPLDKPIARESVSPLDKPIAHKPIARQSANVHRPPELWTLTLNRYQRDNLLLLLNRVGYPHDNPHRVDNLGDLANSPNPPASLRSDGDWLGEIVQMLAKVERWEDGKPVVVMVVDENDRPNGDWA